MKSKHLPNYPFDWFDQIINVGLNAGSADAKRRNPEELESWKRSLRAEAGNIWKQLKLQTFRLLSRKKISVVLTQYQESLQELGRQAMVNMAAYPDDSPFNQFCGELLSELEYLQEKVSRRYAGYLNVPLSGNSQAEDGSGSYGLRYKVTCRLSVDQIAIILKAADDSRLLTARSFSLVLRSITPFLSTERMTDFSWKSARTSTMKMEQRDKQEALAALEGLIAKIKNY